jgi:hypothetical protein
MWLLSTWLCLCMLLLLLTFLISSEVTLCSPLTTFSHLFQRKYHVCSQRYHCINSLATVHITIPHHLRSTRICHNVYWQKLEPKTFYQAISTFLSHSEVTRRSNRHNVQIYIAKCRIYNGVVGNKHDMHRSHTITIQSSAWHIKMSYALNWWKKMVWKWIIDNVYIWTWCKTKINTKLS